MNETNLRREMGNTNNCDYRVSLIIPIYNKAEWLDTCFHSILNQSIDHRHVEVLMIDDGSQDDSLKIMKRYADKYENFKWFTKENGGPAQARNVGIKYAAGKYIMYLDPDDWLGTNTIENVCKFFDKHYDEIDVVTYKIIPIRDGVEEEPHFRYEILQEEGIYDLTEPGNSFICHTNMNTCVKNQFENNVLFSEEKEFWQEDQKYNIDTLKEKQKIGYCDNAEYYYIRNNESTTSTKFYAYYIFESSMNFWEEEFSEFSDYVPYYVQALYISDISWKLRMNKLLPYHYDKADYNKAWNRITSLLSRCDDAIIINHPNVLREHILYWLSKKKSNNFHVKFGRGSIDVFCCEHLALSEKKIHLTLEQFRVADNEIKLSGTLKPLYSNIVEDVSLQVLCGLGDSMIPVPLKPSSVSRFHTHEITNQFYNFEVSIDTTIVKKFRFVVIADEKRYETDMHFSNRMPFRRRHNDSLIKGRIECKYLFRANGFIVRNLDAADAAKRKLRLFHKIAREDMGAAIEQYRLSAKKKKSSRIWLYYDCKNVRKDNGFYQFEHDVHKNDGVQRFYILDGDDFKERKKEFPTELQNRIVRFGSRKHVNLFLMAELIVTAFAEIYNYSPMTMKDFKKYSFVLNFPKIVYLQHGVLHAHLPWKYSLDRLKFDKEVISSHYEEENLIENYGFDRNHLIKAGMPRYDCIDLSQKSRKKILYAPTWRRYLIDRKENDWVSDVDGFVNSSFYKSVMRFINDDRLDKALEAHGYTLDIQLHPIFKGYNSTIRTGSRRVNLITDDINATDYEIFITDFSSFVFDFVYLSRKIMYFVPDYDLFKSGMNGYYRLDLPLEEGFGPFVQNEEDAVNQLIEMMDAPMSPRYLQKMQGFFMYKDNHQRERIYEALKEV
nr:glycosyltransferase [uncultured Mogibacterium sp.]